jgi:hypothetical protein
VTRKSRFAKACLILCLPMAAAAGEKSLAFTYGPSEQIIASLDRGRWGVYGQPVARYSSHGGASDLQLGARWGAYLAYTAFTYRALECRLQAGGGAHWVRRTISDPYLGGPEQESDQSALELWMQPEFRFFGRFSIVTESQVLRYAIEEDPGGRKSKNLDFHTPDLSLSGFRVGFRYYLRLGSQAP